MFVNNNQFTIEHAANVQYPARRQRNRVGRAQGTRVYSFSLYFGVISDN